MAQTHLDIWRTRWWAVSLAIVGLCFASLLAAEAVPSPQSDQGDSAAKASTRVDPSTVTAGPAAQNPGRVQSAVDSEKSPLLNDENSYGDIEAFLKTARVEDIKVIKSGITRPLRLTLSQAGVTRRAVFRHVDVYRPTAETPGGIRLDYRDSAVFECAAYKLAQLLLIDHIPPTVLREFGEKDFSNPSQLQDFPARKGSLQIWVENAMTEERRREEPQTSPSGLYWMRQFQEMWLIDALIFNEDRNQGNILIDSGGKLWFIDATRSFRPFKELRNPNLIELCQRTTWNRLTQVTDEQIEEAMEGLLSGSELRGLIERRHRLVEYLSGLIRVRGEDSVLFDHREPQGDPGFARK